MGYSELNQFDIREVLSLGYILPISHYAYTDYQKRVTEDKRDPFHIEGVFKTILETKYRELADEHSQPEVVDAAKTKFTPLKKAPVDDRVLARVTGKGCLFSKTI